MPIKVKIVKKVGGRGGGGLPDKYTVKFKSSASIDAALAAGLGNQTLYFESAEDADGRVWHTLAIGSGAEFEQDFGVDKGLVFVNYDDEEHPVTLAALTESGWADTGCQTLYIPEAEYDGFCAEFFDAAIDAGLVDSVIPPTAPKVASIEFTISPAFNDSSTVLATKSGQSVSLMLSLSRPAPTYTISNPVPTMTDGSAITEMWFCQDDVQDQKMDSSWSMQIPPNSEGGATLRVVLSDGTFEQQFNWEAYEMV